MNEVNIIIMKGEYGDLKFGNDIIAKIASWQMDKKPGEYNFLCTGKVKKILDIFVLENYTNFIFEVDLKNKSYIFPAQVESFDDVNIIFSGKERPQIKWHEIISSNQVPSVWN